MEKGKHRFSIGTIILVLIVLLPFALVTLFLLALSGQLDKKTDRDVREYLRDRYGITGARLRFAEESRASAYDRCWLVDAGDEYPLFCVKQFGGGMESPFLKDDLADVRLVELYEEYQGEKGLMIPEIIKAKNHEDAETLPVGEFIDSRLLVFFSNTEEYEACAGQLQAFEEFLSEHDISHYDLKVMVIDLPVHEQQLYTAVSSAEHKSLLFLEKDRIRHAVAYRVWSWLEGIDEARIEDACEYGEDLDGTPLSEIWQEHLQETDRRDDMFPYYMSSEVWNTVADFSDAILYQVDTEGGAPFFYWNPVSGDALLSPGDEVTLVGTATIKEYAKTASGQKEEAGAELKKWICFTCAATGDTYYLICKSEDELLFDAENSSKFPWGMMIPGETLFEKS